MLEMSALLDDDSVSPSCGQPRYAQLTLAQEHRRRRRGRDGRREHAGQHGAQRRAGASADVQRGHAGRAARAPHLRHQAGLHAIRRSVLVRPPASTDDAGQRPFGVAFLFAGHDPHFQFQLYASDPSGNYSGWKASCIGANNSTAQSLLRQDYKDDVGLDDALELAVKVLSKTMDSTTLDSEKVEFATLTLDDKSGKPTAHILSSTEVDALLKRCGVAKAEEETR